MLKWEKIGKTVHDNGETEIRYQCRNLIIETRKRAIPHAGGQGGYWFHTTYFLIMPNGIGLEFYTMAAAKEYAKAILEDTSRKGK